MIKMKKTEKWGKMSRKKRGILAGALAVVLCLSVVAVNGYWNDEITRHDGDVLVDSLNISAVPGTSDALNATSPAAVSAEVEETALVTSDDISELANADAYFEEVRATINMDRNQVLSMLTEVIEQAETDAEKGNATNQKLKIIDYMDKEKTIESLIETKGLPECLVLLTDNAVNVTVNKQDLTQSDVAKICDIVMRETGRNASQIVIQSKF